MRITAYSLWLLIIVYFLSGCGTSTAWKSALGSTAGSVVVSSAEQTDSVVVMDLTDKQPKQNVVKPKQPKQTKNALDWEPDSSSAGFMHRVPANIEPVTPGVIQEELGMVNDKEEDSTLLWFFFSMMLMGMIGASIIGIIEAVQNKKQNKEVDPVKKATVKRRTRKTK